MEAGDAGGGVSGRGQDCPVSGRGDLVNGAPLTLTGKRGRPPLGAWGKQTRSVSGIFGDSMCLQTSARVSGRHLEVATWDSLRYELSCQVRSYWCYKKGESSIRKSQKNTSSDRVVSRSTYWKKDMRRPEKGSVDLVS